MKKCLLIFLMGMVTFTLFGCAPKEESFTLAVNELNEVYAVGEEITVIGSITNNSIWTYTIGSGVSLIKIYTDENNPNENLPLLIATFHEHETISRQNILSFSTPGEHTIFVRCWFKINEVQYLYTMEFPVTIQSTQEE